MKKPALRPPVSAPAVRGTARSLCLATCLAWAVACVAAEAPPSPVFDVMEYVIEGNTVLPAAQVERLVEPYLGPARTFQDIEAARAALEKAYQDAGYLSVVVSLPNQRVDQGEVRLAVTEATVEKLKVTGARHNLPSRIAGQVPALAPGEVPYFPQVQQELADVQRADLQLTPLIAAGSDPDRIQVELKVEDQPAYSGSVELNNRQSFNTRRGRLETSLSYNNLFQRGHSMGLSWQYAPTRPSDANTLTWLYGVPLGVDDNLNVAVTHSSSDTPTGTSLGGATLTRGTFYALRWRHALDARGWPVSHALTAGLDIKHNQDRSRTGSGLTTEKPPLRYPVLSVAYEQDWQGAEGTRTGVHTSVAFATRDMASRQVDCEGVRTDQFDCKRYGARPDFMVWKLSLDHQREFGGGWRLTGRADAQLASGPLASGEQFSLGGPDTVRGYYDYEQAGDQGWNVQLSLATPDWLKAGGWRGSGLVFFDRGAVMLKQALAGQDARVHMASYGLGLRVRNGQGLEAAMDAALPIHATRRAADEGGFDPATRRQKLRWELSVRQAF